MYPPAPSGQGPLERLAAAGARWSLETRINSRETPLLPFNPHELLASCRVRSNLEPASPENPLRDDSMIGLAAAETCLGLAPVGR